MATRPRFKTHARQKYTIPMLYTQNHRSFDSQNPNSANIKYEAGQLFLPLFFKMAA